MFSHVYMCMCVYMYMCMCSHRHVCVCVYMCMCIGMCVCMYVCMYSHVYVCVCECVGVYVREFMRHLCKRTICVRRNIVCIACHLACEPSDCVRILSKRPRYM